MNKALEIFWQYAKEGKSYTDCLSAYEAANRKNPPLPDNVKIMYEAHVGCFIASGATPEEALQRAKDANENAGTYTSTYTRTGNTVTVEIPTKNLAYPEGQSLVQVTGLPYKDSDNG